MGREIRKVPGNWEHPRCDMPYGRNVHKPLMDGYNEAVADWDAGKAAWDRGEVRDWAIYPKVGWVPIDGSEGDSFEEWDGERPKQEDYVPDWPEEERTHFQVYETVSEGTPLSPAFATKEELAEWLVENGHREVTFGERLTFEKWMRFIDAGWAMSMVTSSTNKVSRS